MVDINLYKKKKPKLKLTTVLVLIAILLLPVLALRLTIETIKQTNLAEIKGKYQYARTYIGDDDIEVITSRIKSENTKVVSQTNTIKAEIERIKKDLVYAGLTSDFINELGIQFDRYKANEKIFLEAMNITRGKDFFLKYYNVNSKNFDNHQFSEELKKAYETNGLSLTTNQVTIDFMLVNILQEEITAKTAKY
ncbi:MAG: hypothetical protein U9N62_03040 [Thermotogota bacterium]|nr:hypothetical protein [Thermotogota bacterium]